MKGTLGPPAMLYRVPLCSRLFYFRLETLQLSSRHFSRKHTGIGSCYCYNCFSHLLLARATCFIKHLWCHASTAESTLSWGAFVGFRHSSSYLCVWLNVAAFDKSYLFHQTLGLSCICILTIAKFCYSLDFGEVKELQGGSPWHHLHQDERYFAAAGHVVHLHVVACSI